MAVIRARVDEFDGSERETARVAALLEEADTSFSHFVQKLDAYAGTYAAHMEPDKRRREIDNLKLGLAQERDDAYKPLLALSIVRLARAAWDWPAEVATAAYTLAGSGVAANGVGP